MQDSLSVGQSDLWRARSMDVKSMDKQDPHVEHFIIFPSFHQELRTAKMQFMYRHPYRHHQDLSSSEICAPKLFPSFFSVNHFSTSKCASL